MKHTMGNSPRCKDCYWFKEKEYEAECSGDGWCLKGLHVNGKQIIDRCPTRMTIQLIFMLGVVLGFTLAMTLKGDI